MATTIPSSFLCPVSAELMADPRLCTKSGHTFDASVVAKILAGSRTCPFTRLPVTEADFVPNRALADGIEEWLAAHPEVPRPSGAAGAQRSLHTPQQTVVSGA